MDDSTATPAIETTDTKATPAPRRPRTAKHPENVTTDERLGPHPGDVTHWRCRRVDDGGRGNLAESHVEAGVRKAVGDAGKTAMVFAAGGILAGLVAAGIYAYRKHHEEEGG